MLVCLGATAGFWTLYAQPVRADIDMRRSRLVSLRNDVVRGQTTARRLPEFQAQVGQLEDRLESLRAVLPEEKDVADILRRIQGLAAQSNLSIQRFTPQAPVQQGIYAEVPFKLQAEGTYHSLGAFFDRLSKFPRIINVSNITIRSITEPETSATIVAECVATTFVLQQGLKDAKGKAAVPKQPSLGK